MVGQAVFGENDAIGLALFILMFITLVIGIPAACGVAILKYRLYDLDVVIRKSFVFASLAAFITLVYALSSAASARWSEAGEQPGALVRGHRGRRDRVPTRPDVGHRLADRLVFGRARRRTRCLPTSPHGSESAYAAEDVLQRMAQVLAEGTGADRAGCGCRSATAGGRRRSGLDARGPTGSTATPPGPTRSSRCVHQGELLGALSVTMPANDPMTPAEGKLVADLASQAGLVLRNVRLIEELRASRAAASSPPRTRSAAGSSATSTTAPSSSSWRWRSSSAWPSTLVAHETPSGAAR